MPTLAYHSYIVAIHNKLSTPCIRPSLNLIDCNLLFNVNFSRITAISWREKFYESIFSSTRHQIMFQNKYSLPSHIQQQGRIQDFKLGGPLKKNRAERREARKCLGYFVWKITILHKKIIFSSNFRGGCASLESAPEQYQCFSAHLWNLNIFCASQTRTWISNVYVVVFFVFSDFS